jgi:membrane protein
MVDVGSARSGRARRLASVGADLVVETYQSWRGHRIIRLGAALAYYALFAVVPLLSVGLALAGLFIAEDEVEAYLVDVLNDLFGTVGADVAGDIAAQLTRGVNVAGLGIIGFVSLLFAASLLVLALQDAFNTVWEVPVRRGMRNSIARRLLAFGVVLATGGVLVLSFALNAVTSLLDAIVPGSIVVLGSIPELIGLAGSWALGISVIVFLFRYLTDADVPWRPAIVGGAVTALLMAAGTVAIGAYLRRYAATSLLGATGSVFLVLLWIYYQAQILLMGAELTRALAVRR